MLQASILLLLSDELMFSRLFPSLLEKKGGDIEGDLPDGDDKGDSRGDVPIEGDLPPDGDIEGVLEVVTLLSLIFSFGINRVKGLKIVILLDCLSASSSSILLETSGGAGVGVGLGVIKGFDRVFLFLGVLAFAFFTSSSKLRGTP